MKKVLLVAVAVAFVVTSAFAGNMMSVSVFGGYSTVVLKDANDMLKDAKDAGADVTMMGSAFDAGLAVGYNVMPELSLGVKAEYLGAFDGKATQGPSSLTIKAAMIPVLFDASYMVKLQDSPISLGAGVGLGYGFASGSTELNLITTTTTKTEGGAFVAELAAKGAYAVSESVAITLDLGYRLANVAQLKYAEDIGTLIKKGDVVKTTDSSGNEKDATADYSGLIANIGVQFGF